MKTLLYGLIMCQSMFCAFPCPLKVWDEKARDKMLLFLPVIGLEIGALWCALAWFCGILPPMVRGIVLCAFPYVVTGFIHLDGFMDVTDAVRSCRSPERRREILKDPHVGSFAVIALVLLMISGFALQSSVPAGTPHCILIFIPVVSRCCSALAITGLKPMPTSQYATQQPNTVHIVIYLVMLTLCISIGFLLCGKYGFCLVGCLIGYGLALCRAFRSLGGINGDISGYALTLSELWAVAIFALI